MLLTRAQRAKQTCDDIQTNDLRSLIAGACVAEQHAGMRSDRPRLATVLLNGLRTSGDTSAR